MAPVLAMVADRRLRDRIRVGVRSGAANDVVDGIRRSRSWAELRAHAGRFPGSPAFVDAPDVADVGAASDLAAFQRARPTCPVVVCAALDGPPSAVPPESSGIRFAATLAPADGLAAIGAAVLKSVCYADVRGLADRLKRALPVAGHALVDSLLDATVGPCPVSTLAKHSGTSEATLRRRCTSLGLPAPRRLVALARIFHVERLARWCGRRPGAVAVALGYSNWANYARSIRRELGCTSSDVGQWGGSQYVAARLLRDVCELRTPRP